MEQNLSKKTRTESDLIGSREVPESALYGVQTLRGIENFRISKFHLNEYPLFIQALAITKRGPAVANRELDLLTEEQADAILKACKEILEGKHHDQFPVDMIQGGAGTTTNMNANEVIANRALELMGHQRGEYQYCSPNDHVNRSQSTNDAYPTAIHIGLYYTHLKLVKHFEVLIESFRKKATEFAHVIKMGRTQLEDAVPMTLGQTFNGFASILEHELKIFHQYVQQVRKNALKKEARAEQSTKEHMAVMEAIKAHNADEADRLATRHILNSIKNHHYTKIEKLLEEQPGGDVSSDEE